MDYYSQEEWRKRAQGLVVCDKGDPFLMLTSDADRIDDPFSIFMLQFISLSLVSHLLFIILRPLKQPRFVCNALGSIMISPHLPGRGRAYEDRYFPPLGRILMKIAACVGLVHYILIVAVKMDLYVVRRTAKKASIIAFSCVLIPFVTIGLTALNLPSLKSKGAIFLGLFSSGLAQTRFPHVASTLNELNIMTSDLAQVAMASSFVTEMFEFLRITMFLMYTQTRVSLRIVLTILGFVLLICFLTRPLVKHIVKKTPEGKQVKEIYIILLLLGALIAAMVGDMIGCTIQLGAFVMGLIIPSGPPLGATLCERSEHIVMDVLMPLFYVVIGYTSDVSLVDLKGSWEIVLCTFLAFLAKFLGAFLSAMFSGFKFWHATLLGLMMNVKGPLDYLVFLAWLRKKVIGIQTFTVLTISHLTLMAILTPLIDVLYDSLVRHHASNKRITKSIQATPPDAELRILCCIENEGNVLGIISLIEASNPSTTSPICAYVVHKNELTGGRATPFIAPYREKSFKGRTPKDSHRVMQAFMNYSKNSSRCVQVKPFIMVAPYKNMHEFICKLAQDQLVSLIIVPFHENPEVIRGGEAFSLRSLNKNVQLYAPCTVGILVDKGMRNCMSLASSLPCAIAVVFIGGADDREALSLASRMLGHANVWVTLLQIILLNDEGEAVEGEMIDRIEEKLDFAAIEQFKQTAGRNKRCRHCEVMVNSGESAIKEIHNLEDQYNLIMVGHQQRTTKLGFMLAWTENPELGVIGNILASSDFGDKGTSVFVLKHCKYDISTSEQLARCGSKEYEDKHRLKSIEYCR